MNNPCKEEPRRVGIKSDYPKVPFNVNVNSAIAILGNSLGTQAIFYLFIILFNYKQISWV